jgi:hypothetical protein
MAITPARVIHMSAAESASPTHLAAIELAVECQRLSKAKYNNAPHEMVRAALFILSHDGICVHRAVGELVQLGWSSPGAVLVRTLLDIVVSELAVVGSARPQLAALKFLYSNLREFARDPSYPSKNREDARRQVREAVNQLPPEDRAAAMKWIGESQHSYWFVPEWRSPSAVIKAFASDEFVEVYQRYSAAAHGGFMGMRLFRDDPDSVSIDPRLPPGRFAQSVGYTSSKLLVELVRLRDEHEQLGLANRCSDLVSAINAQALA